MSDILKGKLENQEIREVLSEYKFSSGFNPTEKLIDSLIDQFWFHDFYNSFISDPIFLGYLCQYINKTKPAKFNRYDFYEFLFDQILKDLKKRQLLHQIALSFEMLQTDVLEPDHYGSLLKAVNAPKELFDASWMEKNRLAKISEREGKKLFIWEHHSLTEFLVAEHLLSYKNFLEEFQKLAILEQEGIIAFKPSWLGVLRFLMESKRGSEIISWFVEFLEKYPDNIDDNVTELLVYESIEQIPQIKSRIFTLVYEAYFKRIVWLPVWARSRIAQYVNQEFYKSLKEDIKEWSNTTETFVRRGNVVSIVEGLFEYNNPLITESEKKFWRDKLIDFANNPKDEGNGVLQRHSLAVLAYFKDEKIIPLVAQNCFDETQDSLIRDEFIQFCYNSAPNSKVAVDYFIKGIKKGSTIYARHGLYKITTREGIEYFLSKISQDEEFLKAFLKHESIFDKEGADQEFIKNIEQHATPRLIGELKKLVFTVMRVDDYYNEGQSKFLHQIVLLINKHDPKYLLEILEDAKNEKDEREVFGLIYESKELLAFLITKENVKQYFDALEGISDSVKRYAQYVVYNARRLNGDIGEQAYQEAMKLGFVEKVDEGKSQKDFDEQQKKRKQDTYNSFLNQLEPSPGQYMPSVFKYFLQSRKDIEEQWKEKDKRRLLKLAVEGIQKIDPRQFKVKIESKHEGNSKFTWSTPAAYYGDILEILKEIAPEEITQHRQSIIDFIPYEFDTGSTLDFVQDVQDKELQWVNKVMSDKKDDRRYLIPQTYIYLIGEYAKSGCKLPSVKPVLESFIGDSEIQKHNQSSALENLVYFIDKSDTDTKSSLKRIFKEYKNQELAKIANSLLIIVYREEEAIDWRFNRIKSPLKFNHREVEGIVHSVGSDERELDSLSFAHPLLELKDEKYLDKFFKLLDYSFKVLKEKKTEQEQKEYWEYINYLWKIVIAFVENLKDQGSFKPLLSLENWVSKNPSEKDSNWLEARIRELRRVYINEIGKAKL